MFKKFEYKYDMLMLLYLINTNFRNKAKSKISIGVNAKVMGIRKVVRLKARYENLKTKTRKCSTAK